MPTALRNVRYQGQSGKHMLSGSFSVFDPTETCRESCGLLASTVVPGLFLDELDLAQGSKGPTGHLSSGSVSRRSIPVYGVLLADAEDCALDERG
jgi:hypothetical protein